MPPPYNQRSVRARIEAFFLDHIGEVVTREEIMEVATDPITGLSPENWHQRLSELRTDSGYTILSWRNRGDLKVSEYLMPSTDRRETSGKRIRPTPHTWQIVLQQANYRCAWEEPEGACDLRDGDLDPIGGGTVRLSPDHKQPHAMNPNIDSGDPDKWQPLCGRHQVVKKNYWDHETGWLNVYAIVQSASESEKRRVYEFLRQYFNDT